MRDLLLYYRWSIFEGSYLNKCWLLIIQRPQFESNSLKICLSSKCSVRFIKNIYQFFSFHHWPILAIFRGRIIWNLSTSNIRIYSLCMHNPKELFVECPLRNSFLPTYFLLGSYTILQILKLLLFHMNWYSIFSCTWPNSS